MVLVETMKSTGLLPWMIQFLLASYPLFQSPLQHKHPDLQIIHCWILLPLDLQGLALEPHRERGRHTPDSFLPASSCVWWFVGFSHSLKHLSTCDMLVESHLGQRRQHELFQTELYEFSLGSFLIGLEAGTEVSHQQHLLFRSR